MSNKLSDILQLINFRRINSEEESPNDYFYFDADSVRIYLGVKYPYFDFGVYDFGEHTTEIIEKVLNKDILEKEVDSISYENKIEMLVIYLKEDEEDEQILETF